MFTIGIFSTHIPYLAFVFFYAWFLLFGTKKVDDTTLCTPNYQIQIEQQDPGFHHLSLTDFHFYDYTAEEISQQENYIFAKIRTKWPQTLSEPLFNQQYLIGNLFCRPPPTFC